MGRAQHAVEHGLLLLALAVLAAGNSLLLSGPSWWATIVTVSAVVLVVTGGMRMLRVPAAPVGGLVAGFVAVCWVFASETLAFGLLPTPASVERLGALLDRAGTIIVEEPAPVTATAPLVLLSAGAFGLVAVAVDWFLQRRGGVAAVGVLLVAVYLVPAVVVDEVPAFWALAVPAAAWLVLLRQAGPPGSERPRGLNRAAGVAGGLVGAGALVAAATLPPVLPDTSGLTGTDGSARTGVFERGINPMLRLGDDLRRNSSAVALEYTTEGPAPYLSVAMLRDFTGETWEPVTPQTPSPEEGLADVAEGVDVAYQTLDVRIRGLRSSLLPVSYPALDVDGLTGSWEEVAAGLTYVSDDSDTREQQYRVTSLERRPTTAQLAVDPVRNGARLEPYLTLPDDLPPVIAQTAEDIAGDEVGVYAKARALQDHFRSGAYEYSETAPVDGDYDGDGAAVIERFLTERSGYCVHFASSMAVMARALDVPARIVVGYAPGQPVPQGANNDAVGQRYQVGTDDLHAWPQVYVQGVGWVNFEPTPGIAGGSQGPVPEDAANTPAPSSAPAPGVAPEDAVPAPEVGADAQTGETDAGGRSVPWVAVMVLLALALVPGLVRLALRRLRLRAGASADDRWREVVATARDLGTTVTSATTVRAHADELSALVPAGTRAGLDRLAADVERRRYGPPGRSVALAEPETDPGEREAAAVVAGLFAHASSSQRLRARLLPRSLLR